MPSPHFTLLVNSCDAFADTWHPFFELLKIYGSGLEQKDLLLVTEKSVYQHEGLEIRSSRANRDLHGRLPWGTCVLDALDQVPGDLVLYVQDDYFIEQPVDMSAIDRFAQKMLNDPSIGRIGLTHSGSHGPFDPTEDPSLSLVRRRARYRIMCQASLWRNDVLRSYLRADENAWMFELYGSRRSRHRDDRFLTVSATTAAPIRYTHTGIIKGKWHRAMPELFARHGIPMDFERRGFYDAPPVLQRKWQTFRTLLSAPERLIDGFRGR